MAGLFDNARNLLGRTTATIGNVAKLPELGISERLVGTNQQTQPLVGSIHPGAQLQSQASTNNFQNPGANYPTKLDFIANQNQQGQVAGLSTGGGGGGVDTSGAFNLIDQEYNANLQALANQEGETRSQYSLANQGLQTQSNQATANIQELQKAAGQQLDTSATQTKTGATNALNDARRAYNELQQRNAAQLSAGNLSSSSVAEALGEQLGRKTYDTLNQIQQNRDTVLQNIEFERTKATDFYNRKQAEVVQGLQQAQAELQNQMQAALNRINEAKTLAENQKAAARQQVIQGARAAYSQVSAKAAEYQQALDFHNRLVGQADDLTRAYAVGDIGSAQFGQNLAKLQEGLRGTGMQFDYNSYLQAKLGGPQTGITSFFRPVTIKPEEQDQNLF